MAQAEVVAAPVVQSGAEPENGQAKPDNGAPKASHEIEYRQITPYLVLQAPRAAEAIEFYKKVFGAIVIVKSFHPKRKVNEEHPLILHAHLKIGEAELMISDDCREVCETVESSAVPHGVKMGSTMMLHLQTSNVDAVFSTALEAGAKVTLEVANQPWGHRYGMMTDPFGFVWGIATPINEAVHEAADIEVQ